MALKKELQERNRELTDRVIKLSQNQIPAEHIIQTCSNCGASVLIFKGAYSRRFDKDKAFYCAVGHRFVYSK